MFPGISNIALDILRFGSVSIFLGALSSFVFLLLVSKDRREAYLSKPVVRRFVEYLGNVDLGDEGSSTRRGLEIHRGGHKVAGRA
ncbi:MAG: hypothetical protein QOF89_5356 [Acidobacteriota bacterium]|jgi:hypothetical protein|nr:hypothetical protein [Acidobacteriota bacterium]